VPRFDTICYLVRHADAGARGVVDDSERTLSKKGRGQADRIATLLRDAGIATIVSSPYVRCVETVGPISEATGVAIDLDDALGEGAGPKLAIARIEAVTTPTVLCSHGDVIGEVMARLARRGVDLDDDRIAKASTWELTVAKGAITAAHYVPPPQG
jgi:8-oxo-dGTP diphosphatase